MIGWLHEAADTGTPVVPIVLSGTESMMQKGSLRVRPGTARVQFLPVVDPRTLRDRNHLLQTVRDAMIAALPPHMRPLDEDTPEPSPAA